MTLPKQKLTIMLFLGAWLGGSSPASATIIQSVARGGGSTNTSPQLAPNPLLEDAKAFVDRQHEYNGIPTSLLGAEYVMVANSDKTVTDYSLDVTVGEPARLLLFLDNRLGRQTTPGGDPLMNPDLWAAGMGWVYDMGFADTGLDIDIDEGGDGDIEQWSSVYAKNVWPGTITLLQQYDVTRPGDRNMYGVAALKRAVFRPFWFYNARLALYKTPGSVTVPSGYSQAWGWWQDEHGNWHWPGECDSPADCAGDVWDWQVDDYTPPADAHDPYDCGLFCIRSHFRWGGEPHFYAFNDRLTFEYDDSHMRRAHRWFYFWDPLCEGFCIELLSGEHGGDPTYPLDPNIVQHLIYHDHTFIFNAGAAQGEFSNLVFLPFGELEAYIRNIDDTSEADVQAFIHSNIVQRLWANDPSGEGIVGVQHARWSFEPVFECSAERLEVSNGDEVAYTFRPCEKPTGQAFVDVESSDGHGEFEGSDPIDGSLHFLIDPCEWDQWQMVKFRANVKPEPVLPDVFNPDRPLTKTVRIAHYLEDDPTKGFTLPVKIKIRPKYLRSDINRDHKVDFRDMGALGKKWLASEEPPTKVDPFTNHMEFTGLNIGAAGGSDSFDPETDLWTVNGAGSDIWGTADSFHFLYQEATSRRFQMTATVRSLEGPHDWAKAGIMIRYGLEPDEPHATIVVTPKRGVAFQWRETPGGETYSIDRGLAGHLEPPVSLRLEFKDETVTGYYYAGGRWREHGSVAGVVGPGPPPKIGLAVTSHSLSESATATFGRELVGFGSSKPLD